MIYDKADEVILNQLFLVMKWSCKHQWMCSLIVLSSIALPYKFYKIILTPGGSYIGFLKWIKNIKTSIIPINDDDKWFQYVATVTWSQE